MGFWSLWWVVFWSDKTDVCMAVNNFHAAKWVHCYITLHFSSFYFTDPPAPDEGTWPKQFQRNDFERLILVPKVNTKWLTGLCVHACVWLFVCDIRELWHAVWPSSWGWDSSGGQAPWRRAAVHVQHDCTGDRWDQLCHDTGTKRFDLLFVQTHCN